MIDHSLYTWFDRQEPPRRPGVYLTKAVHTGNKYLTWWRAWDGAHWRCGVVARDTKGNLVNFAPFYQELKHGAIIGDNVNIRWTGIAK